MKTAPPFSKSILLLIVSALLIGSAPLSSSAQKRGSAPQKSASRAAGLVDEADKMADDKKWSEAIDAYKIAIRLDANYAPAYGGLGDAYFNSGNSELALAAYKEQARLAPNDAQAQFDLGYFYNAMGRHGEAFGPLVKATSLDPNFAEAYYGIGYAYLRGADFEKSISFLRSAVRLKPDYGDAYYGLGQAYARLGKAELASEQLKKLNTIDSALARKLEKEMQSALAEATASTQTSTPARPASTSPETATEKQAVPVVETAQAAPAPVTQTPAPPPASQTTAATTEPVSRQLQQLPPAQTPATTSAPAVPAPSQVDQVTSFPVSAKRWALVIGVDKYTDPQISPLKGSDNDARLLANALVRYAGFPQDQVILLSTDQPTERQPTRVNILRRFSNLSTAVPKDGLLLVSFAGHGMERSGQAFLLPSDAQISDQISFLEETAISMTRVKERIKETGVGQVVVLLDACRNDPGGRADAPNPLSNAYTNAFNFDTRNREVQAFATVYATGIGQRAYEYTEKKQGYFSWAVVEGLKGAAANDKGEITLSQLVKYVQDTVPKRLAIDLGSTKQQKPFAVIEGFRADELVVAVTNSASNTASNPTPNVTMVDPAAIELSFWESIKNSNSPDDFKAYLDKYPDGQFASLAKSRAQRGANNGGSGDMNSLEMTYWNAIKDSKNSSGFVAYITKFPNGVFVDLAKNRIAELDAEAREREKAKAAAVEMMVDGSTWVGKTEADLPARFEFNKGGMFSGTFATLQIPVTLAGTWRQNGETVTVQLSKPSGFMQLNISDINMQGGLDLTKFNLQKVLMKPLGASENPGACNLNGFKIKINYRKKDKIDRTEDAEKLAAKLRSLGAQVEVEKLNWKDSGTTLIYFNGQDDLGNKIAECIREIVPLKAAQGGQSSVANTFALWLQ